MTINLNGIMEQVSNALSGLTSWLNSLQLGDFALTRGGAITIWGLLLAILAVVMLWKVVKRLLGKIIVIVVLILLFAFGSKYLDLNVMSKGIRDTFTQVVDVTGDEYARYNNGKIQVQVNSEWLDADKIKVQVNGGQNVIQYEGRQIMVVNTSVFNTLQSLASKGLLGG